MRRRSTTSGRTSGHPYLMIAVFVPVMGILLVPAAGARQDEAPQQPGENSTLVPRPAGTIAVEAVAADDDIAGRLSRILDATGWFAELEVQVDEGVVFFDGRADTSDHREWAGDMAGNLEGVVAVVNRLSLIDGSMWDLTPAWLQVQEFASAAIRRSPVLALGLLLVALSWGASVMTVRVTRKVLASQISSRLLRDVVSRAAGLPVLVLGLYLALRVAGLTGLAVTVLGGTGILGLIVGFAFRDIAENFLASLLISIQNPFATGDRIIVAGYEGFVQSVNARSTVLMKFDGNHVQIPNATIYKENITNLSTNPNTRFEFTVGIGYDDSVEHAQSTALGAVKKQPGVVDDPESLVLVDGLGASTVNLKILFWVNTSQYGGLKVRSTVIRAVKHALEEAGVSMPDEAREIVFPDAVPVRMLQHGPDPASTGEGAVQPAPPPSMPSRSDPSPEGNLETDEVEIREQAERSRLPEGRTNLLKS